MKMRGSGRGENVRRNKRECKRDGKENEVRGREKER